MKTSQNNLNLNSKKRLQQNIKKKRKLTFDGLLVFMEQKDGVVNNIITNALCL